MYASKPKYTLKNLPSGGQLLMTIVLMWSCGNPDNFSNTPTLSYIGQNKTQMLQSDLDQDSVAIEFSFTDGDGDIGQPSQDGKADLFVIDQRTGEIHESIKFPELPDSKGRAVSGSLKVWVYTSCCFLPFDQQTAPCSSPFNKPTDTISYIIYMKDRAGNQSNSISSEPIILLCK